MTRSSIAILTLVLLAGCARQNDSNTESPDAGIEVAPVQLRPDANNAVGAELTFPPGWLYRLDRPDENVVVGGDTSGTDIWFVTMTPGWHITSGPSAVLYHPASTAEGAYTVSSKIHLFEPGTRNEAYGLFFGGQNLQDADQTYLYFLIRRSGEFLVKRRIGEDTEVLSDWTASDAIVPFDADTEVIATNILSFSVSADQLSFFVNDVEVHSMEKGDLETDGIVGFRLNHGVNSHIETFDVSPVL